jgi:lysophospholipase L1-like esterase
MCFMDLSADKKEKFEDVQRRIRFFKKLAVTTKAAMSLLIAWAALGQEAEAAPATTIPVDNPVAKAHGWTKECEDRIAAAQGQQIDIIFIGDSITQNFVEKPSVGWNLVGRTVWDKYYANRNVLNLGVGSDGTEHILWRLEHENILSFKPKVVVLLAGVNDAQYSEEDIAAGVKSVIDKIQSLYPLSRIVVMNILPTGRATEKMKAANQIIQAFANNQTIFSLDLSPEMPPVGDNWFGVGFDRVHLTPKGYEIWAAKLDPLLDKLMGP